MLFGAGGHGKVVLDALLALGYPPAVIVVADESGDLRGRSVLGIQVRVQIAGAQQWSGPFHVAIGNGLVRARIAAALLAKGAKALTVVHPAAVVAPSATLGSGSFIAAGAVVGPEAWLGNGVIVNHGAIVDHGCSVGDFAHIGPNATIGGGACVGAGSLIGAGAAVLAGGSIGEGAIVGAGAVVVAPVGSMETHVGVPAARVVRREVD